MEYVPYKKESSYDSELEAAKNIKVKLAHAALFDKDSVL